MAISQKKIEWIILFLILFTSMLYPGGGAPKVFLLAGLLISRIMVQNKFSDGVFNVYGIILPIIISTVGMMFILRGVSLDAPGAAPNITVFIIYPLILGMLAATLRPNERSKMVQAIYYSSLLVLAITGIGLILLMSGVDVTPYYPNSKASIGSILGYTRLSFKLVDSLNYIIPFLTSYMIINRTTYIKKSLVLTIIVAVSLATGRKAIWLMFPLSILLIFLFGEIKIRSALIYLFIMTLLALIAVDALKLDWDFLYNYMKIGFDFSESSEDSGAYLRGEQAVALLKGFFDQPLLGHGIGATALNYGSVSDEIDTYNYELSYNYLLFAVGIFGFLFYLLLIIFLYVLGFHNNSLDVDRKNSKILLIALSAFLISNATNPWLSKFDFMYTIFLPYAYFIAKIKYALQQKSKIG